MKVCGYWDRDSILVDTLINHTLKSEDLIIDCVYKQFENQYNFLIITMNFY